MALPIAVKQYFSLLRTLLKNTFSISIKGEKDKIRGVKKLGKIGVIVLIIFGCACLLGYLVTMGMELTLASINSGTVVELQYGFVAVAQLTVLFFGIGALINNLYFAKDNNLLSSLPFENGVIFGAKFTLTYLGELLFAALVYLPLTITSGAVLMANGYGISWVFFLIVFVNLLFIPALPLMVATLISQPMMLLVSRLKRKSVGGSIAMALFYVAFFILYFMLVMGTSFIGEEGAFDGNIIGVFVGLKKGTIFNYPLVEALLGNNVALNLLIYLAGVLVILAISILLSLLFYKKAILNGSEGDGKVAVKVKDSGNKSNSFIKSYILKDLKILIHTPQLFINLIMLVAMPPIVLFFMSGMMSEDPATGEVMNTTMFIVAFATYLVSLLSCVGNPFAYIGFSLEGKNLYMLKALPLSHKEIIKAKFIFASIITVIASVVLGIVYPLASSVKNAIAIIGLPIQALVTGLSFNAMGLYFDLKNPNLHWTNLNEITRNNLKTAKPMMLYLLLSFLYLIIGIMLAVFSDVIQLNEYLTLGIYYLICLISPSVILVVYIKRLFNSEELYRKIGG